MIKNYFYLIIVILSLAINSVKGQNWTGNVNSAWNNSANWQGGVLPTALNVVIDPVNYTGAGASPIISVNSTFIPAKVDVQNGGVLTVQANLTTTDKVTVTDVGSIINMSAGTMSIAIAAVKNLDVKRDGVFNLTGGNIIVGKDMNVDKGGHYSMTSGTLSVTSKCKIKDLSPTTNVVSIFDLSAGVVTVGSDLELDGKSTPSSPQLNISGGSFSVSGNTLWKGGLLDFPHLNISGGTVTLVGNANNAGANVDIDISLNGLLIFQGQLNMTLVGDRFDQSGTSIITFQNAKNWTNAGIFTAIGTGTVFINGITTLLGTGNYTFYHLILNTTRTMNQSGPTNITVNGNWTNNTGTFVPNANRVTFNGSVAQIIGGLSPTTFYNLTINNTSSTGVSLFQPVTVNTGLILTDGIVYTDNVNILTLIDNATSTSGVGGLNPSFVDGPMKKTGNDIFVFPVGDGIKWRRLAMTAPATITSEFTAQYFDLAYVNTSSITPLLTNVSTIEYWTLNRAVTLDAVRVTLYWEDASMSGINNCADLTMAHWNGISWIEELATAVGTCVGAGVGTLQTNAVVTSFSPFTFGSKTLLVNPLPIELLSFTAKPNGNSDVLAEWVTATEINNDYFELEHSLDGITFNSKGVVNGAGNSTSVLNYSLIDNVALSNDISYYRLKQVDFNGKFSYSDIVAVDFAEQNGFSLSLFPNPNDGNYIIANLNERSGQEIALTIFDENGKLCFATTLKAQESKTILNFKEKLSPGFYFIKATSNKKSFNGKFVVQ